MLELQKLPRLSILEEILISLQIPFGYLIKLRQMDGVSQRALKGHIITFRTDAADGVAAMDDQYQRHMQLPHASESVLNCIKASFIGPEGHADYLKALGLDDGPLRCDLDKMMDWLEVLKAVHSGYKDVQLRGKTDENRAMFSEMPNKIINVAQRVHSETCRAMEATVGADVAGVRDDRQSAASMPEPQEQEDGMVVDMDDPQAMTKLNLYFQTCAILDAVQSDNDAQEASILTQLQRLIDGPNGAEDKEGDEDETGTQWEAGTLEARREAVPASGYDEDGIDTMLAGVFPSRAIFGTFGPPARKKGALPIAFTEYLFMHSSCAFGRDCRFPFMLFNMLQRHAVARATNLRIKSESDVVERFMSICNHPEFVSQLREARQNPKSEQGRKMLKALQPLMASIGSKVPYSPAARRTSFGHCLASMLRFGTASFFLTMSFDDKSNCLSVRLCHPSLSQDKFPAVDAGLRACMEHKEAEFAYDGCDGHEVRLDITDRALLRMVSENPAAASIFFRTQFDAVLQCLLGVDLDRLRTVAIGETDKDGNIAGLGVLGLITDFNGNVEVNQVRSFRAVVCRSPSLSDAYPTRAAGIFPFPLLCDHRALPGYFGRYRAFQGVFRRGGYHLRQDDQGGIAPQVPR